MSTAFIEYLYHSFEPLSFHGVTLKYLLYSAPLKGRIAAMTKKNSSFSLETALVELNKIVEAMEHGNLSLEDSLCQFEKGIKLTRECQQALQEASQKVQVLMKQNNSEQLTNYEAEAE